MAVTVGLAGAGHRATEVHGPAIAACAGAEFRGVWARTPEPARRLADAHDVPTFATFADLLDECDAVVFAVPPAAQAELAAVAAHRHRAILLERPIAADIAGAEELARAVLTAAAVSQLALAWRYSAAVRRFLSQDVPATAAVGGRGRLVSGALASDGPASPWRIERGVLLDQGPDLLDLLDAALGPIVGVRAHGDPDGWLGIMLEHQVGRASEASLYATSEAGAGHADVEVFGPGGEATLDCGDVIDADTLGTLYDEFVEAVSSGKSGPLDVDHGLHLQRVLEAAETDLIVGG